MLLFLYQKLLIFFYSITTSITSSTSENEFLCKKDITSGKEISDPKPILPNIPKSSKGGEILPIVLTEDGKELLMYSRKKDHQKGKKVMVPLAPVQSSTPRTEPKTTQGIHNMLDPQ